MQRLERAAVKCATLTPIALTTSRLSKFLPGRHFFPGAIFLDIMIAFEEE